MTTAITFTYSNFHLIFAAGTHCAWLKHVKGIYVRVLSARSHLATVQMQVIEVVSAAQCYMFVDTQQFPSVAPLRQRLPS